MNKRILNVLNLPKKICVALLGEKQKPVHRMVLGLIFMALGVFISKSLSHYDNSFVEFIGDLIGYAIHGTGCVPFIDFLTTVAEIE
jgi:hypothetical protein